MPKNKPAKKIKNAAKAKAPSVKGVLNKAAKKMVKRVSAAVSKPLILKKKVAGPAAKAPVKAAKKSSGKPAAPIKAVKVTKEKPLKAVSPAKIKAGAKALKSLPIAAKGKAPVSPGLKEKARKGETVVEVVIDKPPVAKAKGKETKGKKSKEEVRAQLAPGKRRCREPGCDNEALLAAYCRLHYIKNWRRVKRKEAILATGQLNNYVEELVNKYPDKYLDVIRQDLASEKDWAKVVIDLELESSEEEAAGEEDIEAVAEGVRRERDFDDEGDAF